MLLFGADKRLSYGRLLAFGVATWLLVAGHIDQTSWLVVTSAFIALEGAERVARATQTFTTRASEDRGVTPSSNPQEGGIT